MKYFIILSLCFLYSCSRIDTLVILEKTPSNIYDYDVDNNKYQIYNGKILRNNKLKNWKFCDKRGYIIKSSEIEIGDTIEIKRTLFIPGYHKMLKKRIN